MFGHEKTDENEIKKLESRIEKLEFKLLSKKDRNDQDRSEFVTYFRKLDSAFIPYYMYYKDCKRKVPDNELGMILGCRILM